MSIEIPLDDCVDYALERENVVELLGDLEASRDQRSIPVAEAALGSSDPVVTEAGLRLLGPFASGNEHVADVAAPLVASPYVASNQLAARILRGSQKYSGIAQQYDAGHSRSDAGDIDPWARWASVDFAKVGFRGPYPGSTPYPPCDSPMSIGFATSDAPDAVVAHYRKELGREPMAFAELPPLLSQRATQAYDEAMKQVQPLQEEFARTQDPKVLERMQEVMRGIESATRSSLAQAPFPSGPAQSSAKAFVAEQDPSGPERVVVVYTEPVSNRSVVMLAWSAPKYPPIARAPKALSAPPL